MPRVIVIGYRGDLDRALRRRGLDPFYVVQAPMGAPDDRESCWVADFENAQEVLRAVLARRLDNIAGVLSVHEMGVFTAAYLRQQLRLPGNTDSRTVLSFRDKYLQKSRLLPEVRRARCRHVPKGTSYQELIDDLGKIFVVKPATGAGALRTNIIRSAEEYERALALFSGTSDVEIVAESFIDAPEVYIDGIWRDGELQWSSMGRYHEAPVDAAHDGTLAAWVLDRRLHTGLFQQAETIVHQVLGSLGAPDCVFHLEIFEEETDLTFGECAIRLPGGLSPQVNELTYGVDLFDAEISLALGEPPTQMGRDGAPDRFYGFVLLRRPDSGHLTQEDFERAFRFDQIHYDSSPDAPVGPYGRIGQAIVSDPDESKLEKTIHDIVRFNATGGT
ncbi:ATP-grasp domain-containing protein [Streptomyces sp. NBC_01224]|uniref:ATP-grasp domain-containing protein n=1 Tax=Streptomyces sp. NBC_01224 TaxID=2903783 RepID=UPI002E123E49|nr:ATP-grasp domain-containing protein [Streptomyces sp. NBC_01224]